jgi:hypothetical protein
MVYEINGSSLTKAGSNAGSEFFVIPSDSKFKVKYGMRI